MVPAHSADTPPPIILNVEDFEPARFLRSRVLRDAGFEVIEAASADEALSALASTAPQLALVDVHLPDGDGFNLCEMLKRAHPRLPVVLISAVHITSFARDTGFHAGADDFLLEPVPPDTLVESLKNTLLGIRNEPPEHWILTDSAGFILESSAAAAHLLNLSATHLRGRQVLLFFERERASWQRDMQAASGGVIVRRSAAVRPRERRPFHIDIEIAATHDDQRRKALMWSFIGSK